MLKHSKKGEHPRNEIILQFLFRIWKHGKRFHFGLAVGRRKALLDLSTKLSLKSSSPQFAYPNSDDDEFKRS